MDCLKLGENKDIGCAQERSNDVLSYHKNTTILDAYLSFLANILARENKQQQVQTREIEK